MVLLFGGFGKLPNPTLESVETIEPPRETFRVLAGIEVMRVHYYGDFKWSSYIHQSYKARESKVFYVNGGLGRGRVEG